MLRQVPVQNRDVLITFSPPPHPANHFCFTNEFWKSRELNFSLFWIIPEVQIQQEFNYDGLE